MTYKEALNKQAAEGDWVSRISNGINAGLDKAQQKPGSFVAAGSLGILGYLLAKGLGGKGIVPLLAGLFGAGYGLYNSDALYNSLNGVRQIANNVWNHKAENRWHKIYDAERKKLDKPTARPAESWWKPWTWRNDERNSADFRTWQEAQLAENQRARDIATAKVPNGNPYPNGYPYKAQEGK